MMTAPGSPPCEEEVEGVVDASARRGSRKGHSSMRRQLRYWQPFNDWCGGTGCKGGGTCRGSTKREGDREMSFSSRRPAVPGSLPFWPDSAAR